MGIDVLFSLDYQGYCKTIMQYCLDGLAHDGHNAIHTYWMKYLGKKDKRYFTLSCNEHKEG